MKILYLKKMGCDFWDDEQAQSDIKNYRVRTQDYNVQGKDGRVYFVEFSLWRDRKQARTTHKITGKPLKHTHYDIINRQGLAIDLQYQDDQGTWGNYKLIDELLKTNYSYNTADILTIINRISKDHYDAVRFVGRY